MRQFYYLTEAQINTRFGDLKFGGKIDIDEDDHMMRFTLIQMKDEVEYKTYFYVYPTVQDGGKTYNYSINFYARFNGIDATSIRICGVKLYHDIGDWSTLNVFNVDTKYLFCVFRLYIELLKELNRAIDFGKLDDKTCNIEINSMELDPRLSADDYLDDYISFQWDKFVVYSIPKECIINRINMEQKNLLQRQKELKAAQEEEEEQEEEESATKKQKLVHQE